MLIRMNYIPIKDFSDHFKFLLMLHIVHHEFFSFNLKIALFISIIFKLLIIIIK